MLTEKIKFRDLEGVEKIHTLYFNLNEAEITSWEASMKDEGGLQKVLERARDAVDNYTLLEFAKDLLRRSVGVKSADNTYIEKSAEISTRFENSVYYSDFLFSLFETDGVRLQKFINTVMPADLIRRAAAQSQGNKPDPNQLTPKERWDIRQREKNNQDPEVVDFTSFGDEDVQAAYSTVQQSAPENPAPPVQYTPPAEESRPVEVAPIGSTPSVRDEPYGVPVQGGPTPDELEQFRKWQEQNVSTQPAQPDLSEGRPPHESGPGQQFNQQ